MPLRGTCGTNLQWVVPSTAADVDLCEVSLGTSSDQRFGQQVSLASRPSKCHGCNLPP